MLLRRDPDFADAPETTQMADFVANSPHRVILRFSVCQAAVLDLKDRLRPTAGRKTPLVPNIALRTKGIFCVLKQEHLGTAACVMAL